MAQFLSEYVDANKMARVIFEGGVYGCTFFVDNSRHLISINVFA